MVKQLEKQIQDLQKELSEIKKELALLRLQPCQGDIEIREKEEELDALDRREEAQNKALRDLTRQHQIVISKPTGCNN